MTMHRREIKANWHGFAVIIYSTSEKAILDYPSDAGLPRLWLHPDHHFFRRFQQVEIMAGGQSRAAKKRAKQKQKGGVEKRTNIETKHKIKSGEAAPECSTARQERKNEDDAAVENHAKEVDDRTTRTTTAERSITSAVSGSTNQITVDNERKQSLLNLVAPFEDTSNEVDKNDDVVETVPERARKILQFLLEDDLPVQAFYDEYWEKQPVHIASQRRDRFDGFLSLESLRKHGEQQGTSNSSRSTTSTMKYGQDLNVTRYQLVDGGTTKHRVTLDPAGRPVGPELWTKFFDTDHCTVRYLAPQKLSKQLHSLLSLLESEWGCMVGCNAYLTPAQSQQGFAPHYDDIEAFVLQLEGSKRWKVYKPLSTETTLPRISSRDYVESELTAEPPELDILLRPGDVLYMPRGWIHQAVTTSDEHSLHITISAMQQWSWGDLMELWLPEALADAVARNVDLRAGLPRNLLDYTGVMHDQHTIPEAMRQSDVVQPDARYVAFREEAKQRLLKVVDHAMGLLDSTCDQMGKRFMSDRLPPAPMITAPPSTPFLPNTLCRIARPGIARLVIEANDEDSEQQQAVVYHCVDNSLVYHERALSPLEFELDDGPAIEQLLTTVAPHWISIMDLTHESIVEKVGVAHALFEEGILTIRN
jgi:bifunctional lysine-specific demethylase and histidyl-hydroxylase NO66